MPFDVPASKKSIKQNRFEFTIPAADDPDARRNYSIPLLKFAPVAAAEAFEQDQPIKAILLALDNAKANDDIRALDGDQFGALIEAWQEASGITAGESEASTDS